MCLVSEQTLVSAELCHPSGTTALEIRDTGLLFPTWCTWPPGCLLRYSLVQTQELFVPCSAEKFSDKTTCAFCRTQVQQKRTYSSSALFSVLTVAANTQSTQNCSRIQLPPSAQPESALSGDDSLLTSHCLHSEQSSCGPLKLLSVYFLALDKGSVDKKSLKKVQSYFFSSHIILGPDFLLIVLFYSTFPTGSKALSHPLKPFVSFVLLNE